MKALILALASVAIFAAGLAIPATPVFAADSQAQKSRPGQERGQQGRPDRRGGGDDRRPERLNDDERRALHRDLDKANRELYKPRPR